MSIRVFNDGADGYRLISPSNDLVGWIRGRAIGVGGFADEDAAVSAAIRSYCILASWLEQQGLHALPTLGDEPARCIHDGAYRWILIGRLPVARLTTGTPCDASENSHAFELVLRESLRAGLSIHAALIALRAAHGKIDAADIAWAARADTDDAASRLAPTTYAQLEVL
jgi:hypothetical protein